MAHGRFVWNELLTRDTEAAKRFYATLIGWSFRGVPMPDGATYWVAEAGGQPAAGIMAMPVDLPAGIPPHWFEYLEVDDVDSRVRLASQNGGRELRPAFDVPDVGRLGFIADSTGAVLGLMTPTRKS